MTLLPRGDNPRHKPPSKRALTYGVGAIGAAIGTILAAGGQAGANQGTIRLAISVFGVLATLALTGAFILAWTNGPGESEPSEPARRDANEDRDADSESTADVDDGSLGT